MSKFVYYPDIIFINKNPFSTTHISKNKGDEQMNTNKPTRLRTILVKHVQELNPDANYDKIDALEEDIKTFVRHILHSAEELGLEVKCTSWIGDMN
jgi:ribosomal protein L11